MMDLRSNVRIVENYLFIPNLGLILVKNVKRSLAKSKLGQDM